MRPLRALAIYGGAVFGGAGLLAPWIHALLQWAAVHAPILQSVAQQPFHRYVNRCLLVLALAGLWPLMRALGVHSLAGVGLVPLRGQMKALGFGASLGFAGLASIALLALVLGVRQLSPQLHGDSLLRVVGGALTSAIVVSSLEELLFRGVLYAQLRHRIGNTPSLIGSSVLYALVHFFQKPPAPETIHWLSGFSTLAQMIRGFADWMQLVPGFLTLLVAGVILARLVEATGALYASIALHAAWIFCMKIYWGLTTAPDTTAVSSWLWGSGKLIDGWSAFACMGLSAWAAAWWIRSRLQSVQEKSHPSPS